MAITLLPPLATDEPEEAIASDNDGTGIGGGNFDDIGYDPHENSGPDPGRWGTPPSAYRTALFFGMVWIVTLFATLTRVLESRWVHSKDWVSIPLPRVLYVNLAILMLSSLTIELARFSLLSHTSKRCARWLLITLLLGIAFFIGQIFAWREIASRGLRPNPGSFFFYLITAAHGVHLLGGIIALASIIFVVRRMERKSDAAMGVMALYWHFMGGLWLYLLGLLFVTIQH